MSARCQMASQEHREANAVVRYLIAWTLCHRHIGHSRRIRVTAKPTQKRTRIPGAGARRYNCWRRRLYFTLGKGMITFCNFSLNPFSQSSISRVQLDEKSHNLPLSYRYATKYNTVRLRSWLQGGNIPLSLDLPMVQNSMIHHPQNDISRSTFLLYSTSTVLL